MTDTAAARAIGGANTNNRQQNSDNPDAPHEATVDSPVVTTGSIATLAALCAIARFHQVAADPATLAHQLSLSTSDSLNTDDLLRAAKHLGLKAKLSRTSIERLPLTPLPALALMRTSDASLRVVILAQCDGKRVLFQDIGAQPDSKDSNSRPTIESAEVFATQWTGELILITSRASLAGELAKFDFSWFIPSLVKYRKLLGEVLLISFMLQIFGLVSPLFFQVVMGKVLVHKGLPLQNCVLAMVVRAIGILGLCSTLTTHAKLVEEVIRVPVKVSNSYGKVSEQEVVVTLFHENTAPTPYPIAVINHGRAPNAPQRAAMGRAKYSVNSAWLARLGFLVVVPTRVGYGETGGEDLEDTGDCGRKDYPPGYEASATQTLQILQVVRQRPDTAKDRAVVIGQSFGGATAITVAAKNPPGVQATINFAGGGGGNPETKPQDPCAPWALEKMFADYGKTARIPTLWVYTENDMYFGPKLPKQWFDAFKAVGGTGEYMLYPPLGKNGHGLFTLAPDIWHPRVLEFLRAHGYPDLKGPEPAVTKAAVNVEAAMSR